MSLPIGASARKGVPIATGCIDYFPDAIVEVAHLSYMANEQHNPGTPVHWDRSKSKDEADALMRHFVERGTRDSDGIRHSAKVAWRALALLQKEIEAESTAPDGEHEGGRAVPSDAYPDEASFTRDYDLTRRYLRQHGQPWSGVSFHAGFEAGRGYPNGKVIPDPEDRFETDASDRYTPNCDSRCGCREKMAHRQRTVRTDHSRDSAAF